MCERCTAGDHRNHLPTWGGVCIGCPCTYEPPLPEWHPPAHVAARVEARDCQVCVMGHAEITRQHHNGNH